MENSINGLHHITALAAHPQDNFDFYTGVLGLRLVKKTVNFDAPDVYHLYFADEFGTPGTVLTFFPFPHARPGTRGAGEANAVMFSVPSGSLAFWKQRLETLDVGIAEEGRRFDRDFIGFDDPEGMRIEITEDEVAHLPGWETGSVPRQHSLRKFFGTRVLLRDAEATKTLLLEHMGLRFFERDGQIERFASGEGDTRAYFDIETNAQAPMARQSAGSIHHIAWRTANDENQLSWMNLLNQKGYSVTPVIDRNYFHSIYYREPGGVLFEIATDNPGFAVDEELHELGLHLKLPGQYESQRAEIERLLIPLNQQSGAKEAAR